MKSKLKDFIFSAIIAIALSLFFVLMFTAEFKTQTDTNIDNYHQSNDTVSIHDLFIDIQVTKENKAYITESFSATFNMSGLREVVRFVQYFGNIIYEDEEGALVKNKYILKIHDISGSGENGEKCITYYDEETGFITIGLKSDLSVPAGVTRNYTVSYICDLSNDENKGFDQFYYNIIGTNSILTIKNISFSVAFPEEVSEKDLFIYTGKAGSSNLLENYTVGGNIVTGSIDKLGPTEGVTIRAIFEDDYFLKDFVVSWQSIICVVIAIISVSLSIVFIVKYKERKKLLIPVEVIAPEGLYPAMAEYLTSYKCSSKSLIATLLYLGERGYIRLNQIKVKAGEQKTLVKLIDKEDFEIIKIKDIRDDEPKSVIALYNALFKSGDKLLLNNLDSEFYSSCNAILTAENYKEKSKLYKNEEKKKVENIKTIAIILSIALNIFTLLVSFSYLEFSTMIYIIHCVFMGIVFIVAIIVGRLSKNSTPYVIGIAISLLVATILLYTSAGFKIVDSAYLVLVANIIFIISVVLLCGEPKYKRSTLEMKGRVLGFKNFINKCEVKQIEMFVNETPEYFYKVLPYAYVFGLTNEWIGKFDKISKGLASWITVNGESVDSSIIIMNTLSTFTVNAKNKYNSLVKAATSFRSSGGSFSGGGGGFSGGGMGGGGFGAR